MNMDGENNQVTYRPFEEGDADALARLVARQWYGELKEAASLASGTDELCHHLARSTAGFVAVRDGALVGACLAHAGQPTHAALWQGRAKENARLARDAGIDAHAPAALVDDEDALVEEVALALGEEATGYLELLIVSPAAQGLGVGRTLMGMGLDHLRDAGATRFRLVTDDGCDWQFYDHIGMRRVGEREARATSEADGLRVYCYEGDL